MTSLGLLVLRVGLGLTVSAHGAQKLFGWYGGSRIAGFSAHLDRMGLIPATFWAWIAALSEFVGGLLVALGLLGPLGCFAVMGAMSMAIWLVHWPKGFFNTKGGIEFPLMIWVGALASQVRVRGSGPRGRGFKSPRPELFSEAQVRASSAIPRTIAAAPASRRDAPRRSRSLQIPHPVTSTMAYSRTGETTESGATLRASSTSR